MDILPSNLSEFFKVNENHDEYSDLLKTYAGRLESIVKAISPNEIKHFLDFILNRTSKEEQESRFEYYRKSLEAEYRRNIDDFDPYQFFDLHLDRSWKGWKFARLDLNVVARALWQKDLILQAFNHPLRLKIRKIYEQLLAERIKVNESNALPPLNVSELLDKELEFSTLRTFAECAIIPKSGTKVSRLMALAIGVYTALGQSQVGIPFGSETMYSVIGNPVALADILRCHGLASVPRNGLLSDPTYQANLALEIISMLRETPFLAQIENPDDLVRMWLRNFGIVVEANPYKACKRIEKVLAKLSPSYSIAHVRIYMVEGADEMFHTAKAIAKYFPQLRIHLGQIVTEQQVDRATEIGIESVGIGVASGSRCSTSVRSGIAGQNFNFMYKLRKLGLRCKVFVESGLDYQSIPIALASGVSRINFTNGLLGFLSANGGPYGFEDSNGDFFHPYDGEASEETKRREKRVYSWDFPVMLEGVNGWQKFDPEFPTIPHKLWYLTEVVCLTNTFSRHLFHEDLLFDKKLSIALLSPAMVSKVTPYSHDR